MGVNKYTILAVILFLLIPIYIVGCWELYKYMKEKFGTTSPMWVFWMIVACLLPAMLLILHHLMKTQDSYSLLSNGERVVVNKTLNQMCPEYVRQHPLKPAVNAYLEKMKL